MITLIKTTHVIVESLILVSIVSLTIIGTCEIVKYLGYEYGSFWYYFYVFPITVIVSSIPISWVQILFSRENRTRISFFEPFHYKNFGFASKNSNMLYSVCIFWITIWLSYCSIGWSLGLRSKGPERKQNSQLKNIISCCASSGLDFVSWFRTKYLPEMKIRQTKPNNQRQFVLFRPTPGLKLEQIIAGLFTSFTISVVSNRELIVDWPKSMGLILDNPGWNWNYHDIKQFIKSEMVLDLESKPSLFFKPSHNWKWSDLLQKNISDSIFQAHQMIIVQCNEFVGSVLWANPVYRSLLCSLCSVIDAYKEFSSVLLNWNQRVINAAESISREIGYGALIMVPDKNVITRSKKDIMLDVMQRCGDSINHSTKEWLVIRNGESLRRFPKWDQIGPHHIDLLENLNSTKQFTKNMLMAAIHVYAKNSPAVIGFFGSQLMESLAYSSNKPLYFVFHRISVCGSASIRLPIISKWNEIVNQKGIDYEQFFTSEFVNQFKDKA